jgi:hypothetical protein
MLAEVVRAFELAGHLCTFDAEGDAVCDKEDQSTTTMVIGHMQKGPNVGVTFSTFRLPLAARGLTCKDIHDVVERARGMMAALHVECERDLLALGLLLPVPENGITVRDMNRAFRHTSHVAMVTVAAVNSRGKEPPPGRTGTSLRPTRRRCFGWPLVSGEPGR